MKITSISFLIILTLIAGCNYKSDLSKNEILTDDTSKVESKKLEIKEERSLLEQKMCKFSLGNMKKLKNNGKQFFDSLLLSDTTCVNFKDLDLNEDFYFRRFNKNIENYGNINVGEYLFKTFSGPTQDRLYIFVNEARKEYTIWSYQKIYFNKNYLLVEFNCRGNVTKEKVIYSKIKNEFITIDED